MIRRGRGFDVVGVAIPDLTADGFTRILHSAMTAAETVGRVRREETSLADVTIKATATVSIIADGPRRCWTQRPSGESTAAN
jgi:hypothetical protein